MVVDTDVASFRFKRDTRAERYRPSLERRQLVVSFMTVAELEAWAVRLDGCQAPATAAFVREAAQVYARRGLLAA